MIEMLEVTSAMICCAEDVGELDETIWGYWYVLIQKSESGTLSVFAWLREKVYALLYI